MFFRLIIPFVLALFCGVSLAADLAEMSGADSLETKDSGFGDSLKMEGSKIRESGFSNTFMLRFLCNYNFVYFWTSEFRDGALVTNRPLDIGLGVGYKDFYYDFIYALPFAIKEGRTPSFSFETGFNFFPGDWWLEAKYRRYSGFSTDKSYSSLTSDRAEADSVIFVDLWESDAYVSALWMGNSDGKFSPRAAFFLDKKQTESAGSIIIGGRLQATMAKDKSETLPYYVEERKVVSAWTNMGYSHTWVGDGDFFVNLWAVAGIAIGGDDDVDFTLLPEVTGKMAFGQINDRWSWNIVLETEYMPVIYSDHWEQKWVSAFKTLVVRRF